MIFLGLFQILHVHINLLVPYVQKYKQLWGFKMQKQILRQLEQRWAEPEL